MHGGHNGFNMRQSSRPTTTWLKGFAFITLLLIGGSGIIFWRLQSVQLVSITNNNMAPLLHPGDGVIVQTKSQPQTGEIISYYDPIDQTKIDTQRVIRVSEDAVTTQNESSVRLNAPFSQSLIIGTVQYHVAKLGYVLNFLRSPLGLLIGVYFPALIILGSELKRLSNYYAQPTYRLISHYRKF